MNPEQASAHKFALYLYKNNHLDFDYSISKSEARRLYNNNLFLNKSNTKYSFRAIFVHILRLLRSKGYQGLLSFSKNKLSKLILNEKKIDAALIIKRKNTGICPNSCFNNNNVDVKYWKCQWCRIKFDSIQKFKNHICDEERTFFERLNQAFKRTEKLGLYFMLDDSSDFHNIILRKDIPRILLLKVRTTTRYTISSFQIDKKITEVEFNAPSLCTIFPGAVIEWTVKVCCKRDGVLAFPILFRVENGRRIQQCAIELVFHTHNEFFDDLHPRQTYKPPLLPTPFFHDFITNVDSGERPEIFPKIRRKIPLKQYFLPLEVAALLNSGLKPFEGMTKKVQTVLENIKGFLDVGNKKNGLTVKNHAKRLHFLLYAEEHQMLKDMKGYDRQDSLKKAGNFLELQVPNLAEKRPSIILSDSVFLRETNKGTLYEGFVHQIKESSILLKFSSFFTHAIFSESKEFRISFTFNRYNLRAEHQAVQLSSADNIVYFFFPKVIPINIHLNDSELDLFNADIGNNVEQLQAVQAILDKSAMPAPYLVFGPPGTGKTMTIVEAVKQIYKRTNQNVLICTPSNSAANEVTKRLIDTVPLTDLFRYIASSYNPREIPNEIRAYVNFCDGFYEAPPEVFTKYRIVITTLTFATRLVNTGCPKNHFGYVFVDEAGQATESETLIPIARILSGQGRILGQVVLAGDPKQLGPMIHSNVAVEYGLDVSMLERLMNSEPYKKDSSNKYNPSGLTKLIKNYRSHPDIINLPNRLFYENELQSTGDELISAALGCPLLPNPRFPLVFHSVVGVDQREKDSPSFFNIQEIQIVFCYLEKLIGSKMDKVTIEEKHIGVVSPYRKQVEKIKQACRNKNYGDDLFVGSVEQIQGQEKLIVIISTVRSKFSTFDAKFRLGFLDNPKRFNVAITRAKALLIVIGNPNLLQLDKHWRSLIEFCKDNSAIAGDEFELVKENVKDETLSDAQNMSLLGEMDFN